MIDVEEAPEKFEPFGKTRLWWMRHDVGGNEGARFIDTPRVESFTWNLLLHKDILSHMAEEDVRRMFDELRRGK